MNNKENGQWPYKTPGIPDDLFCRDKGVPMTRSEIRALIISRMRLFPEAVVYDVGAGSGTVAVECALQSKTVYAVEKKEAALSVIRKNADFFNVPLQIIDGEAPAALEELPPPHRIFIGGSGGQIEDILAASHRKLNPGGRLVFTAVTLDPVPLVYRFLQRQGYLIEAIQVQTAEAAPRGENVLWQGRNPVTIISGEKSRG